MRASYRAMVDVLLPGRDQFPAGLSVGVTDEGLDRALELRPDLASDFATALRSVRGLDGMTAVKRLEERGGEEWTIVRLVAFWAYYNSAQLQELIKYAGQPRSPFESTDFDEVNAALLAPVKARAPFWRQPDSTGTAESRAN
jgi:hypothetical protein